MSKSICSCFYSRLSLECSTLMAKKRSASANRGRIVLLCGNTDDHAFIRKALQHKPTRVLLLKWLLVVWVISNSSSLPESSGERHVFDLPRSGSLEGPQQVLDTAGNCNFAPWTNWADSLWQICQGFWYFAAPCWPTLSSLGFARDTPEACQVRTMPNNKLMIDSRRLGPKGQN